MVRAWRQPRTMETVAGIADDVVRRLSESVSARPRSDIVCDPKRTTSLGHDSCNTTRSASS